MGGDNGPRIVFRGAEMTLKERGNVEFIFHGQEEVLTPLLDEFPALKPVSTLKHAETVIAMDDKPSQALRKGRNKSSMWSALQAVKDGEADAVVSCGQYRRADGHVEIDLENFARNRPAGDCRVDADAARGKRCSRSRCQYRVQRQQPG